MALKNFHRILAETPQEIHDLVEQWMNMADLKHLCMKYFIFKSYNDVKCPLCNTDEKKEATLVPIAGTEDGSIAHAIQVHVDCLQEQLWYYPLERAFVAVPKKLNSNL